MYDFVEGKEGFYSGRSVKVYGTSSLDVPIRVSAPGSIVEYTIEKKSYDFNLGITAKLDQGGLTTVKDMGPFDGSSGGQGQITVTDQVLVGAGSVPCTLNFKFENKQSWIVELSYKIRVIPPSRQLLLEGRRRRAQACLQKLDYDVGRTNQRLNDVNSEKSMLEREVQQLSQQFEASMGNEYGDNGSSFRGGRGGGGFNNVNGYDRNNSGMNNGMNNGLDNNGNSNMMNSNGFNQGSSNNMMNNNGYQQQGSNNFANANGFSNGGQQQQPSGFARPAASSSASGFSNSGGGMPFPDLS
ncbi:MAG: hypothetical protein SGARI_003756 [Bacillariaceae sp.]